MSIRFRCKCGREFNVPDSTAGKRAKCLDCGEMLTVPRPHRAPPSAASAGAGTSGKRRPATPPGRPGTRPAARPKASKGRPADDVPVARVISEQEIAAAQLSGDDSASARHVVVRRTATRSSIWVMVFLGVLLALAVVGGVLYLVYWSSPDARKRLALSSNNAALLSDTERRNLEVDVQNRMTAISAALRAYIDTHGNYYPTDLGQIVSKDCPASTFVSTARGRKAPELDKATGKLTGPIDFIYLMAGYHMADLGIDILTGQADEPDEARQLIVCYSDPNCTVSKGAAVLRPPCKEIQLVEFLDKSMLAEELAHTRRWVAHNPGRGVPKVVIPDDDKPKTPLPGD